MIVSLVLLWILAMGLGVYLVTTGMARYFDAHAMVARRDHLNISRPAFRSLGSLEAVAGAGLVLGAAVHQPPWIGLGSALAGLLTTVVFLIHHRRAGDELSYLLPTLLLLLPLSMYIAVLISI